MVLRHRRLFTLSLIAILSVFLAQALPHAAKAFLFFGVLLALGVFLVLFFCRKLRFTPALALLLSALALLSSYQISAKEEAIAPYDQKTLPVSVTLITVTERSEESVRGEGELSLVDASGKRISARVRVSAPVSAVAGSVLYGEAFFSLPQSSYDEASGLFGTVTFRTCRTVDRLHGLRYLIGAWREWLSERLRTAAPGETGELLCALLLGVRDGLSDSFVRDMSRIGTTHILSLSGLHLAILTGGIGALLRRLSLGKKLRLGLLALFATAFMVFTGLSPSVMRAGVMLLFSTLPLFLREERDGLTSLGAAVAIICLLEPYAVRDVSLWLSALSTLGILLLFDRMERKSAEESPTLWRRLLRAVCVSLAVTTSASVATLPLTLVLFETVPLLSPLANLLFGVPVQILLYLALILAIVGGFPPISALAEGISSLLTYLARLLADVPASVLPAPTGVLLVFVSLLSVSVLLYLLFCPRKQFRRAVLLVLCASILLFSVLPPFLTRASRGDRLSLFYASEEKTGTDCILLTRGGERLMTVREAEELYSRMGKTFARFDPWQIYVLTSAENFERLYGRRADKVRKLYNGMIPCSLYQYFRPRKFEK